jgi:hypothetical protein
MAPSNGPTQRGSMKKQIRTKFDIVTYKKMQLALEFNENMVVHDIIRKLEQFPALMVESNIMKVGSQVSDKFNNFVPGRLI